MRGYGTGDRGWNDCLSRKPTSASRATLSARPPPRRQLAPIACTMPLEPRGREGSRGLPALTAGFRFWHECDARALKQPAITKAGNEETHARKLFVHLHQSVRYEKDRYRNQANSRPSGNGTCKR